MLLGLPTQLAYFYKVWMKRNGLILHCVSIRTIGPDYDQTGTSCGPAKVGVDTRAGVDVGVGSADGPICCGGICMDDSFILDDDDEPGCFVSSLMLDTPSFATYLVSRKATKAISKAPVLY